MILFTDALYTAPKLACREGGHHQAGHHAGVAGGAGVRGRCVSQPSIIRCPGSNQVGTSRLLYSNPASTKREKLTVRLSGDEGKTWPFAKELCSGPSAYSCLTVLPDKHIGCLYERGNKSPYETITFARFTLEWLTRGEN